MTIDQVITNQTVLYGAELDKVNLWREQHGLKGKINEKNQILFLDQKHPPDIEMECSPYAAYGFSDGRILIAHPKSGADVVGLDYIALYDKNGEILAYCDGENSTIIKVKYKIEDGKDLKEKFEAVRRMAETGRFENPLLNRIGNLKTGISKVKEIDFQEYLSVNVPGSFVCYQSMNSLFR
jgi:hypothetical protein